MLLPWALAGDPSSDGCRRLSTNSNPSFVSQHPNHNQKRCCILSKRTLTNTVNVFRNFFFWSKWLQNITEFDDLVTIRSYHSGGYDSNGRCRPQARIMFGCILKVVGMNDSNDVIVLFCPPCSRSSKPVDMLRKRLLMRIVYAL